MLYNVNMQKHYFCGSTVTHETLEKTSRQTSEVFLCTQVTKLIHAPEAMK